MPASIGCRLESRNGDRCSGCWRKAPSAWMPLLSLLGAAAVSLPSALAAWEGADARSLALGGISMLHRLELSPGALVAPGWAAQAGSTWEFLGSSLVEQRASFRSGGAHRAWALACVQERSDVHRDTRASLALQAGSRAWRAGLALGVREHRFARYDAWHDAEARLGLGARWGGRLRLACMGGSDLSALAPSVAVAAACALQAGLQVQVQLERHPGLPVQTRAALLWGDESSFAVLCGYDVATEAASGGLVAGVGPWRLHYGTVAHPELGWSHAWTLECAR